ncbi:MAG: hypothetical protein ACRD5F_14395 [Candidatus Acidiferrales bacterium]
MKHRFIAGLQSVIEAQDSAETTLRDLAEARTKGLRQKVSTLVHRENQSLCKTIETAQSGFSERIENKAAASLPHSTKK